MLPGRLTLPIPLAVLLLTLIATAVVAPSFYSEANLTNLSEQIAVLGLVTAGQFLVLLVGGLDLSVGAVMGMTAVVIGRPSAGTAAGFAGLLAVALALGAAVGLTNGLLVVKRKVPAFVVTLGMFGEPCCGEILTYGRGDERADRREDGLRLSVVGEVDRNREKGVSRR